MVHKVFIGGVQAVFSPKRNNQTDRNFKVKSDQICAVDATATRLYRLVPTRIKGTLSHCMPRIVAEKNDVIAPLAELFRERGFEGTSISLISERTGLGKGSLYHFFPRGKEEMLCFVLDEIEEWFETNIFEPLNTTEDPTASIDAMFAAVTAYFKSGRRVCLVGALALSDTRDRFAAHLNRYFNRWIEALATALRKTTMDVTAATTLAEEVVGGIQGAILLSRAVDEAAVFDRIVGSLRAKTAHAG